MSNTAIARWLKVIRLYMLPPLSRAFERTEFVFHFQLSYSFPDSFSVNCRLGVSLPLRQVARLCSRAVALFGSCPPGRPDDRARREDGPLRTRSIIYSRL